MITLNTCLSDLDKGVNDRQPLPQTATVEYFNHHILLHSQNILKDGYEIWVGESVDPFSSENDSRARHRSTRVTQDVDGLRITVICGEAGPCVTMSRTAAATSPMYLSTSGSSICISWKFENVVALLDRPKANLDLCRILLKHGKGQTREQIIDGVYSIWAGEEVCFNHLGLRFSDCEQIAVTLPGTFSDRARASDAFLERVSAVLQPALSRAKRPLVEFSGGMDSTCVAIAASSIRANLETFGVIHPGGVGRQQRARRQELIELLSLWDYTSLATSSLPIQSLQIDECQVTPNDEVYRICMLNVLREHGLLNADIVISGLGGDELSKEHTHFRHDWEVPGHVSASSLVGAMSHADMYMRQGIWLINPLAHPVVVNLCRAMPNGMRPNRLLHRLTMARAGLSDGYMMPRFHETFANVLLLEAVELDFDHLFDDSIIGELGLLDVSRLLSKVHDHTELGVSVKLIGKIYNALKLEVTLKRYLH
jgi:asparagine synthase (glutamine-hydrolysing)